MTLGLIYRIGIRNKGLNLQRLILTNMLSYSGPILNDLPNIT